MAPPFLSIPSGLRQTVLAWFGAEGRAWLDGLPSTVEGLARAWQLALGAPFAGGSASLVLAVTRPDGAPAVLKVPMPDDENRNEANALRHYEGKGAVQLYAHDDRSGALLLELVTPGASLAAHPDGDELIVIACRVIRRLWRPPMSAHPFRPVRELAAEWVDGFPQGHTRHGRPFPPLLIEHATELARVLAQPRDNEVVVNRDAHAGNILSAEREPWLLIDPKPLVGEPAFDAGYLVLDRLDERPTVARTDALVERIAQGLGIEAERARAWALVRAVDNALWSLNISASPAADLAKAMALMG